MGQSVVRNPAFAALMCALAFTLSAVPGYNSEAEYSTISMSSCDLRAELSPDNGKTNATCKVETTHRSGKSTGTVVATMVKVAPVRKLGDPELTDKTPKNAVKLDIQLESLCRTCLEGVVRSETISVTVEEQNFRDLDDITTKIVKTEAAKLAKAMQEENIRMARVKRCEIDEQGNEIAERHRLSCRVDRMADMTQTEREEAYDDIRSELQEAIKDPVKRAQAMQLVGRIEQMAGESAYLKASTAEMKKFGQAHDLIEQIIANPNDPNSRANVAEVSRLTRYFQARGMQINKTYANILTEMQVQNMRSDLDDYSRSLDRIANQHRSLFVGDTGAPNTNMNQNQTYNVRPLGQTGRTAYGAPAMNYQNMPGGPVFTNNAPMNNAPGALRPPVVGQPVRR